jgi:hypothetical protein
MPSESIPINPEWAGLLRGLCMKVPDDWWPGFSGRALNAGVIACVDLDIKTNNHSQLKLDKELGVFYAMQYDAVVRFADETHCSFSSYRLPAHALRDPADDVFVVETVNDDDDEDDKYVTPPPAHNKRRRLTKKQSTINPDLTAFGEEGTADSVFGEEGMADGVIETTADPKRRGRSAKTTPGPGQYTMTEPAHWTKISAENPGRPIEPVPYTGVNEFFGVNMTDAEFERMKDGNGDIRYNKNFEWMLPKFTGETCWDFLVERMRSYMTHLMVQGWKPWWYNPDNGDVILTDHVA